MPRAPEVPGPAEARLNRILSQPFMKIFSIHSPSTIFALLVLSLDANACDFCAIYTANQAEGDARTGPYLGLSEQFTRFGTLQSEGDEVANPTDQQLNSSITQLVLGYGVTEHFSVQANLPFIDRQYRRPEGFLIDKGSEAGLGDVSLIGKFQLLRADGEELSFSWNVFGGLKLPTGSSKRILEEFNEVEIPGAPESGIHGHDLALGSGSLDGVIGTEFSLRHDRVFLTGSFHYSMRSQGDYGYSYADDLSWDFAPGVYLMLDHDFTLALQAVVSGERKGTDKFQGASAADTGISSIHVGPRLVGTWKDKLSFEVGLDLPLRIENTALQAVPDFRLHAGVTWRF
jgi:hypothetical protein